MPDSVPVTANHEWTLSFAEGAVVAGDRMGGDPGNMPTLKIGETQTFQFIFADTRAGADAHELVLSHSEFAGEYHTYPPQTGYPFYQDTSPDRNLLVGIDARQSDVALPAGETYPACWGVLDSVTGTVEGSPYPYLVTMDVFVLAPFEKFGSRQAVRDALAATGPA